MSRKNKGKTAPKPKAKPKAAQPAARVKKAATPAPGKASGQNKPPPPPPSKYPDWLRPFPVDYCVGTEEYAALIEKHNELFGTAYLKWRVKPAVFYTIHQAVWNHYHDKK